MKSGSWLPFAIAALALNGLQLAARGDTIVLSSTSSSGSLNGALFQPYGGGAGTGQADSSLRLHDVGRPPEGGNGVEQGYNTGSPRGPSSFPAGFPNYDAMGGNFTYNIQLGTLGTTTVGGDDYRTLLLDINEPGGGQGEIDLTELRIFGSPTANVVVPETAAGLNDLLNGNPFGGSLIFDLDGNEDNTARLFDLFAGSGQFDVMILIPDSLFAGLPDSYYLYLFAQFAGLFGNGSGPDGGFEEFAAGGSGGTIAPPPPEHTPEPASLLVWALAVGAAAAGYRLRKRAG